jgi:hypothetical protein
MRYHDPSQKQLTAWDDYKGTLSEIGRAVADTVDPWTLYLIQETGQRVHVVEVGNDGTLVVAVDKRFNPGCVERNVFGILRSDLSPIDEINDVKMLKAELLSKLHDPKTGNRYDNHVILDALVTVSAAAIYKFADDKGAGLAALLGQFQSELHNEIMEYDHEPEFHR